MENFETIAYFKVVIYSCELFGIYPRTHERKRDLKKVFSWIISKKVYPPPCEFSNRMMASGLNNGRLKTGVVNMSTAP